MSFLQSSLLGRDFVNYRKNCAHYERTKFSSKVKNEMNGKIPIVVDSVDESISTILGENINGITKKYGKEYIIDGTLTINDFIIKIENDIKSIKDQTELKVDFSGKKIKLGLEDGTIINDGSITLGTIYKKNKNEKDNILYFLITQENTIYGYIISILKYLRLI